MSLFEQVYLTQNSKGLSTFIYDTSKPIPSGKYSLDFYFTIFEADTIQGQTVTFSASPAEKDLTFTSRTIPLHIYSQGEYHQIIPVEVTQDAENLQAKVTTNNIQLGIKSIKLSPAQNQYWPLFQLIDMNVLVMAGVGVVVFGFALFLLSKIQNKKIICAILFVLSLCCTFWWPKELMTGDEPHYLVTMKNLMLNKSLDMEKAYVPDITTEFWDGYLVPHMHQSVKTGVQYSHHGYFMSVLIIPGYILGKVGGVRVEMGLFAGLAIVFTYLICLELRASKIAALAVSLGLLFTPFVYFTHAIFPEIIAAAVLCFGIYAALKPSKLRRFFAISSLGLIVLINGKYIGPSLSVGTLLIFTQIQSLKLKKATLHSYIFAITLVALYCITISLSFLANWELFGKIGLFNYYSGGRRSAYETISLERVHEASITAVAHAFDSRAGLFVWFPVIVVSLLGFLRLLTDPEPKHSYLAVSIFFSLFFYMGLYSYSASLGGDSPALRPWLAMMPMLAILFAKSFDFLHTRWLLFIFFLPTLYMTFGSSAYQLGITTVYTNWVNPFFSASGGGPFNNLGLYLPQLSDRSAFDLQDAFAVIWISLLLLAIFTAVVNFEKVATQLQLLKLKTASWLKPARKYSK